AHAERPLCPTQYCRQLAAAFAAVLDEQEVALLVEAHPLAADQQGSKVGVVEVPVAHRAGIDMHKARMRIPADAAALHRARRLHRLGELVAKMHVEGAAVDVRAVPG